MLEERVNIFSTEVLGKASAIGVTTNGVVKQDGSAVMGLSGDVDVSGAVFRRALEVAIPNCQCCTLGDQPPPRTTTEFMRLAEAQS